MLAIKFHYYLRLENNFNINLKTFLLCFFSLQYFLQFNHCYAQNTTLEESKIAIEKYIENTESTADYTDLYDQIELLIKNPININYANATELGKIPLITPSYIASILSHKKKYGLFKSIYELQTIEGFSIEYIKLIQPYIVVEEKFTIEKISTKKFWKNTNQELIILGTQKQQLSQGYTLPDSNKNAYLGSPQRVALRYRANINNNLQINATTEKDAGEQWHAKTMYFSGNIIYKANTFTKSKIKFLALGDYQAAFGQGLTFSSGLAFGKSPFVLNIMRTQNGLRAYRAFNENEFLRGAATTLGFGKYIDFTFFYSSKKIDATANNDSSVSDGFTSLINTGYHRSANEMVKKDIIKRQIIGSHLRFNLENLNFGITAVQFQYNSPLNNQNIKPYQLYNFNGNKALNLGSDFKWYLKNVLLFGEISTNQKMAHFSYLSGGIISLAKDVDLSFLHRKYHKQATPLLTNAIGESSNNINENGTYIGLSITPYKNYKLNAYCDIYKFDWLRYQVDAPSYGKDMMAELQYTKRKSYNWYLRYRNEQKLKNQTETQATNALENNDRQTMRFHIDYSISPTLNMSNRVEQSWVGLQFGKTNSGFLIFQDIEWKPKSTLGFTARYMFFDIENYNSRLYAFEDDMLYTFTVPAFQNKGTRMYLLCKYKMAKNTAIWLRLAQTNYENINTISSGTEEIKGNKVNEIKCQLRWTF